MNQGQIIEGDDIKFENVPIYTPNGDLISSPISFEVKIHLLLDMDIF